MKYANVWHTKNVPICSHLYGRVHNYKYICLKFQTKILHKIHSINLLLDPYIAKLSESNQTKKTKIQKLSILKIFMGAANACFPLWLKDRYFLNLYLLSFYTHF